MAQRGMNTERERDGESGMDRSSRGETNVQPLHKHRVEGSHHVCIPQAVHVPCRSRHPAVPPQDMLFTSVSRAATLPRQLAPCSWVPPSLFGLGATQNGLMTMAATTFSPRTRTSTRFTEQGHVKKRPLLTGEMAKVVIGSMFSSPLPSHKLYLFPKRWCQRSRNHPLFTCPVS